MSLLKTYNKVIQNPTRLLEEINLSNSVNEISNVIFSDGICYIYGTSIVNEITLDTVITNHEEVSLEEYKELRYIEIDNKTVELINEGFIFDTHTFSLSYAAQLNWTNIKANADMLNAGGFFPITVSTSNNEQYSLTYANMIPFWMAGFGVVSTVYKSGSDLKVVIKACATKEEVDLIIDNR